MLLTFFACYLLLLMLLLLSFAGFACSGLGFWAVGLVLCPLGA
jgi:hypothetical protein